MLTFQKRTMYDYIDLMQQGEYFTLGKFGDGELYALFKSLGWMPKNYLGSVNADRHQYFQTLGEAIHNTFLNEKGYPKLCGEDWYTGKGNGSHTSLLFKKYVNLYDIRSIQLHNADIEDSFYDCAEKGRLQDLKNQLEKMNFVMVSESRKRNLNIKYADFVEIPAVDCWLKKDQIISDILDVYEKYDDVIFGLSAGMPTLPIQDQLYPIIGKNCWMISFGSIWDPYVNVRSRGYHSRYQSYEL